MAIAREVRLKQVLLKAEKAHGKTFGPNRKFSAADYLICLLIARDQPREVVNRSFSALKSDFVDWNEVRVSSIREISLAIKVKDAPTRDAVATRIRDTLVQIFKKHNNLSLSMLSNSDFDRAVNALAVVEGLDLAMSVQIALHGTERSDIQDVPHVLRVARRIGLVEKRFSAGRAREALGALVTGIDVQRFHRLMILLGESVCFIKATACSECPVSNACVRSRTRSLDARSRAKRSASGAKGTRARSRSPRPRKVKKK